MKQVHDLLSEVKGAKAHKQAIAMGLKYKGFGYWVDPATNQVTHKTENDQLVEVEPEQESEKAGKGPEETAGMAPSGGFGNPDGAGGSFQTHMNKQLPTGMGTNIQGVADNGLAQAPNNDEGRWEPGPDGDNFVNDQTLKDTNKPPVDAFVGKTNYYGWTAGKDGDNYTTVTMQDIMKAAINAGDKNFKIHEDRQEVMGKIAGFKPVDSQDPTHIQRGAKNFADMGPTAKGSAIQSLMKKPDTYGMEIAADRMGMRKMRADALKRVNTSLGELVQDRNYDMSKKGEELGSGSFGTVYESADGQNVIKEGQIGKKELALLARLHDHPNIPNLINAKMKTDFEQDDDAESFWGQQEMGEGTIAMSKASGRPAFEALPDMDDEEKEQFIQKLWAARALMHKAGVSHNDMHGENVFVGDDGKPHILDLGLGNDDPLSALMEAIGGATGGDYQFIEAGKNNSPFGFVPEALKSKINENMGNLRSKIADMYEDYAPLSADDYDDPDDYEMEAGNREYNIEEMMKGGLRLTPDKLTDMRDTLPFLEDNDRVFDLINSLYENVQKTEPAQRMSNAYDQLKKDRRQVALANLIRKRKGVAPIKDKLADVLEPDD